MLFLVSLRDNHDDDLHGGKSSYKLCSHPMVTDSVPWIQQDKIKEFLTVSNSRQSFDSSSLGPKIITMSGINDAKNDDIKLPKWRIIASTNYNAVKHSTKAFQLLFDKYGKVHFLNQKTTKHKNYLSI